jgi:lipopolysaccharide export system protein LptA
MGGRVLLVACVALAPLWAAWPPAAAQNTTLGRPHDSSQPIEITADSLEVIQPQQLAIFKGNVDAVQGDLRLRADTLKVHYRQRPAGQPAAAGAAANPPTSIHRIDAVGRVFISSPEETARGDVGVYDVDNRSITLEGQVVLTRGDNVLRGNRATMDLASGRSTMVPTTGERVHGLFVPNRTPPAKKP